MGNKPIEKYADVGMEDSLHQRRALHNDYDKTVMTQDCREEIPEEIMSQVEPYIGDGNAHLTVSGALSSSHEFHKAEAFVSVSITCNNSMEDVRHVHDIVRPFVQELIKEDHECMSLLRDEILPPGKRKHVGEVAYEVTQPQSSQVPLKVASPPQRSAKVNVKPGTLKPTFGR
jgi:DNA-directed RNA polymerase subunit L